MLLSFNSDREPGVPLHGYMTGSGAERWERVSDHFSKEGVTRVVTMSILTTALKAPDPHRHARHDRRAAGAALPAGHPRTLTKR